MDIPLVLPMILSICLSGRFVERRGRSFKTWASIAGVIGPLALLLLFLFPNLHGQNDYARQM
jgi:hypothetical protein